MVVQEKGDQQLFWYQERQARTQVAAREVLALLYSLHNFKRVIDVGCGIGVWLSVAKEFGADVVIGLDGPHVPKNELVITDDEFVPCDLNCPPSSDQKYDLCICLEVAEHLSKDRAKPFIEYLTGFSDCVLFSAAVPWQGGTGHLNEQWQSYWIDLFEKNGLDCYDVVRAKIWKNESIPYWYAQNTFLFTKNMQIIKNIHTSKMPFLPLGFADIIHPNLYENKHESLENYKTHINKTNCLTRIMSILKLHKQH